MASRILLVEDEQFLRELYAETLSAQGYAVDTAVDGEDGYSKISQGGYDLVLIDIIMPKLDGLEVVRRVRQNPPQQPNKKIIFLTNMDKDEEINQATELGNGYLIKSQITPGDLVEAVKKQLESVQA